MSVAENTHVGAKSRDLGLDFVKGFLVIVMALYHAMNYFGELPAEYYGYLRFVNGSFVFVAGYVVAEFYSDDLGRTRLSALRRLASRGAKLLCLFTALNLAISGLGLTNYRNVTFRVSDYLANASSIYGSGDAPSAFRILVPISYLLLLSGLYLVSSRSRAMLIGLTIAAALVYTFIEHRVAPNVFFLLTGLVGLSFGLLKSAIPEHRVKSWPMIVIGFIAIASVMNDLSGNVLAYCGGIALLLKLVYDGTWLLPKDSRLVEATVLLGKYSLVCYIGQITFLSLLHAAWRNFGVPPELKLALAFFATCAFLLGTCALIAILRRHSRFVESTYRLVFA